MLKLARNTVFTIIILILAAVGLNWSRQVSLSTDPVQISQTVLSAAANSNAQNFPLTVTFIKPRLTIGQTQELQIATVPQATLAILTIYPNGSVSNPQTLTAKTDETGHYSLKFKLDDFANLGVFETKVVATSGAQQATSSSRFAVQTYVGSDTSSMTDGKVGYIYPLVP